MTEVKKIREDIAEVEKKMGVVEEKMAEVDKKMGVVEEKNDKLLADIIKTKDSELKTIFCERMKSLVEERKSLMEERKLLVQKDKSLNQYLTSLRERLLSQSKKDSLLPPPKKARYTEPLFEEPKSLHHSPSNTTSEEVKSRSTTGDVYDHWFALRMYELKNYLANNPIQLRNGDQSTLNLPFKGKTVAIQVFHLKEIITRWKQMEKFLYEECSTAALAVGLERFLFPTNAGILPDGVCCHQMPISDGSRVKSNFSVFPYPVGRSFRYGRRMLEQNTFVAVSNFKKSDFDQSKNESFAYSLAQQQGNTTLVRLLFPMTKHRVMLQIYVPISGSVLLINIFDDDTSEANLAQFFCMLYVGVKYLLHSPIKSTMAPHPIDDDELKLNYYAKHTNPRVLISEDNFFYKLYDTVRNKPQLEVAKLVLRDATVEQLSDDGRYCYLKYKYQEDDENPDLNSFQKILNQLHEIHEEGYVHSDIRRQNIVLGKHSACIIDFDLAEKEGVNYPLTYNSSPKIKERHPKAEAGLPREKIHDVHALDVIMRIYNFSGIMEQYRSGKSLLEIATNITEDMEM